MCTYIPRVSISQSIAHVDGLWNEFLICDLARSALERKRHIHDSRGQMMALTFMWKSWKSMMCCLAACKRQSVGKAKGIGVLEVTRCIWPPLLVWDIKFWVDGFGFRILGFWDRVSGWAQDFKFRVQGVGVRVQGCGFQIGDVRTRLWATCNLDCASRSKCRRRTCTGKGWGCWGGPMRRSACWACRLEALRAVRSGMCLLGSGFRLCDLQKAADARWGWGELVRSLVLKMRAWKQTKSTRRKERKKKKKKKKKNKIK